MQNGPARREHRRLLLETLATLQLMNLLFETLAAAQFLEVLIERPRRHNF